MTETPHAAHRATLAAELDALIAERDRLDAEHLAPVRARIKDAKAAIEDYESALAKSLTDEELRTNPALVADLARAAYDNIDAAERLRAFYRSICPLIGMSDCIVHDDLGVTYLPRIYLAVARHDLPDLAATLPTLLGHIPWRTRTAEITTALSDHGIYGNVTIEADLDTGVWTLINSQWGNREVLATGDPLTVLTALAKHDETLRDFDGD